MGKFEGLMKHPEHGDGSNGGFPISPLQPIRFGMLCFCINNVFGLGEGCLTDVQFLHKFYGSFCQTAVTCWAVYQ